MKKPLEALEREREREREQLGKHKEGFENF